MDQSKTGRFISKMRKEQGFTQKQLTEAMDISDKTVSKWECGNGLPEVSLMIPLCDLLNISVNDLLSGERVSDREYQKKAEENMIDLIKENAENKKKFIISLICGSITIVAVFALVMIASLAELPTVARVGLLIFAAAVAAAGVGAACVLDSSSGYFECPHCSERFVPNITDYVKGYHTKTKRRLKCPKCSRISMCRHHIIK